MAYPLKTYISYSERDNRMKEQLRVHLKALERQGIINVWDDQHIGTGDDWHNQIYDHIEKSDIFVVLLSPDYIASDWCYDVEFKRILERREADGIKVIPVILKKCDWRYIVRHLQVAPHNGKPISEWKSRSDAYMDVVESVRKAAYQLDQPVRSPEQPSPLRASKGSVAVPKLTGTTLIIHGHAKTDRLELASFLQNKLHLPYPIVMDEAMTPGLALPAKFDTLARSVEFAIALLTPDDEGKANSELELQPRARQNTLIEIGWFWGRIGMSRVLLLVKGEVDIPSDLQGLEYHKYSNLPSECSEKIRDFYKEHGIFD
jgi:predicted nucleotide-binding protein